MKELVASEFMELSPREASSVQGGANPGLAIAIYLGGCFKAGFDFGYYELGPRIFG